MIPLVVELAASSQLHERFDPRRLHLVRLTQWPEYVQEALQFPGRGIFNRGRWESRTRNWE